MPDSFLSNMSFHYLMGGITPVYHPSDTNWRQLPCWVLVVPIGGRVELETHIHGRMSFKAGCAAIIPPNLVHRFRTISNSNYISQWSHVNFPLPGGMDAADLLETPLVTNAEVGQRIGRINCDLANLKLADPATPLSVASRYLELGFGLLTAICGVSKEKNSLNLLSPAADRIRRLLLFVEEHLNSPLDRDRLAERCNLSPARFHVVFHEVVGVPPMVFVKQQRMKKAQFLLAKTTLPIKLIGEKVGFSDPYIFSRAFKTTTGISPKTYRIRAKTP